MGIEPRATGKYMSLGETRDHLARQWFAIRVKSRCEKIVAAMAQNRGFEEFLPLYHCRHRWSDRVKSVELPLFPGYIFCRLNPEYRLSLLTIPGVLHLVGIGKIPVPIDDAEIAALQSTVRSGLSAEPWSFLEVGQRVRLEDGPLVGLEGILVEAHQEQRLVVSVTLLQRSVAVAIERHWVRPLDGHGLPGPVELTPPITANSLSI
jgi:transcription antitermination factor NusG